MLMVVVSNKRGRIGTIVKENDHKIKADNNRKEDESGDDEDDTKPEKENWTASNCYPKSIRKMSMGMKNGR